MRKKPYKANELFEEICKRIELPDILDYHLSHEEREITTYDWDWGNNLDYGGNEGIYLDIYAQRRGERHLIGTFKTLNEDKESMYTMARLLVDFVSEGRKFVNNNLDDFTWEGFNVKEEGAYVSRDCSTLERAREHKANILEKRPDAKVIIFDYAKRKEVV